MSIASPVGGRFVVEREVAAGGMGRVLRARDLEDGHAPVAIKVVTTRDKIGLARFERECAALARISHPNVVRYIAHGVGDTGEPWLAMEWLDGCDLAEALGRMRACRAQPTALQSELSIADVLTLGRGIASSLAALHAAGIVHRDIKPSNVFLVGGDLAQVKLIDLGIARLDEVSAAQLTQTGMIVGTLDYMAPEQAREDRALGPAVDVFALGSVLYECLTGTSPFSGDGIAAVLVRIMFLEPDPIHERRADVPAALARAIAAMLQKAPDARPADGAAALALLEAVPVTSSHHAALAPADEQPARELTHSERRIVYALLVRDPDPTPSESASLLERAAAVVGASETTGMHTAPLLDGSVVIVADRQATPIEAVSRLARAALRLLLADPGLALVLRGERAELAAPDGPLRHVSTTARAIGRDAAGELRVDETIAALLESRFELVREGGAIRVLRQRPQEAVRTVLGRTTTTVGRKRDLAQLEAIWDECEGESIARVVLVTSPAGTGKTRLVHELVRTLRARGTPLEVLHGQGDPVSAGTPFMLLGSALRRAAGLGESGALSPRRSGSGADAQADRERALLDAFIAAGLSDAAARARHLPLLGVLAGVPFDDASSEVLRAGRSDPELMGEAVRTATCAWLGALTRERPVLLVLEDLHWGDLPSLRLAEAALGALADRPLCVLAVARPELKSRFANPFQGKPLTEHRLEPLPPRAAAELVRQCLPGAAADVVDAIVQRAEGHAFYLEELVRLVADGSPSHDSATRPGLPESVLAIAQARLDAIGAEGKRVLRAASVFGLAFWREGLERVLEGGSTGRAEIVSWLGVLTERELIVPALETRFAGQHEYRFRHGLVREAATPR